jgi:copper resistance protein B
MMHIKFITIATFLSLSYANLAWAADHIDEQLGEKSSQIFHMFRLEINSGVGQNDRISSWDFGGWIGGDINKLWLKSEGEVVDGKTESAEFWALYSRNIDTFWDAEIGIRQETQADSTTYLVAGLSGLAKYFFQTEMRLFISDEGDVSTRIRQENDFLLTQRLILQPYLVANLYAQDVANQEVGSGLANGEIGLQTRYEITRKFAPYMDMRYERKFGETSSIAKNKGERNDDFIVSLGLRLMF